MEKKKKEKRVKPRITYGDYYFQHCDYAPARFDIYKNGKHAALGYGYALPRAMEFVAMNEMSNKTGDRTLKEFITEFRGLIQEIKTAIDTSNIA